MRSPAHASSKSASQGGAIFVELVFTLPLLLLFVWFFIYIGIIYNAKMSLVSAMDNSMRTAMTRGYLSNMLDYRFLYDKIDDLCYYQNNADMAQILFSNPSPDPDERSRFLENYNKTTEHWRNWTDETFNPEHFCNQPRQNLYAVIFTQLAMKQSIGSSLRFPCNPHDEDEPDGGAGCLRCIPLNPCTMDKSEVAPDLISPPSVDICDPTVIMHRVALQCEYRPASIFTQPIDVFLRALTNVGIDVDSITVSNTGYFDIPSDFDWNFGQ